MWAKIIRLFITATDQLLDTKQNTLRRYEPIAKFVVNVTDPTD